MRFPAAIMAVSIAIFSCSCGEAPGEIRVFAPPCLTEVMEDSARTFSDASGIDCTFSFASSGIVAKQIQAGAPVDVFVSAHKLWVDELKKGGYLTSDSIPELAGNTLAVAVREGSDLSISGLHDLLSPRISHIALADPEHGPAGMYARESLESVGIYRQLQPKIIPGLNVRAALAYVRHGEAEAGICFTTDTALVDGLAVAYTIPRELHSPIAFYAAAVKGGDTERARRFVEFLGSEAGRRIFRGRGFTVPDR